MTPTSTRRSPLASLALLLLPVLLLAACAPQEEAAEATGADARTLFGRDAEACLPFLDEAEQSEDPQRREDALARYEDCIAQTDHMPPPPPEGDDAGTPDACYDILEAIVRIQDDVDPDIIRQLHDAYVSCVYDAVTGGEPGPGPGPHPGPGPEGCEIILMEGDRRCAEVEQDDPMCRERVHHEFEACMNAGQEPPPHDPGMCDPILWDVEERCYGPNGEVDDRCVEDHIRAHDQCLQAQEGGEGGEPRDPQACEEVLVEASRVCTLEDGQVDERCMQHFQAEFEACLSGP